MHIQTFKTDFAEVEIVVFMAFVQPAGGYVAVAAQVWRGGNPHIPGTAVIRPVGPRAQVASTEARDEARRDARKHAIDLAARLACKLDIKLIS